MSTKYCPQCGEPVQENWKICPVCESSLDFLFCPLCGEPVQRNWKRCPECGGRLVCTACGTRLPRGAASCPSCEGRPVTPSGMKPVFVEPVTGMEFIYVPAGTFPMGDTFDEGLDNERPVHEVQLDGFYLAKYPVTQEQWIRLMGGNPSRFPRGGDFPVEQVTFFDVQAFIEKLTRANAGRFVFRLPSEAEWEYAARSGGRAQRFAGGDNADAVAWYGDNSGGTTHPVGEKAPNGLQLYDMSGNVWEWCRDTYDQEAYRHHARRNPCNEGAGNERVIRGGGWNLDAWSVRCARRMGYPTDYFGPGLGFRLLREPGD